MLNIKFIIFIVLSIRLMSIDLSCASVYYISNSGNDSNNGLSPVFPWKTIDKLNSEMKNLKPGDAVLFERDGYFTGQINLFKGGDDKSPLIFGAYGNGRNPVISGAIPLKNWSAYSKDIYQTKTDTIVKNLFSNGKQMILARYPDKGFLTIKEPFSNPKTGFIDSDLKQPAGYWEGSNVRLRSENWAYEYTKVKNFTNGRISFSDTVYYPAKSGWGYYLDNNFNELNSENEWFYGKSNGANGSVFYFPSSGQYPENSFIEASIYGYGIYSFGNISNVYISNLNFKNQTISGLFFSGNKSNIKIENCSFSGQMMTGVSLLNYSHNCKIYNNGFFDINGKAVHIENSKKSKISNNVFRNTGMIPGYGTTYDAFGMSAIIALNCDSIHIFNNVIENTGHDAINCIGNSAVIERNIISNSLLNLNDGGAIKSYGDGNSNTVWKNNFIFNVPGNLEGTLRGTEIIATGLYLDAYCSNMKVLNNTVAGCGSAGINFYNENNYNLISGNVCYDNQTGIYFFKEKDPMSNNSTVGNIFFGLNESQYAVLLRARSQGFIPGKFENNVYCNPYTNDLFVYQSGNLKTINNYMGWQKLLGNNPDINSKVITGNEILFSKLFTNMTDDTLNVILDPSCKYKKLNTEIIQGSLTIHPWSSEIILSSCDLSNLPELYVAGRKMIFSEITKGIKSVPLWYKLFGVNLESTVSVSAPDGFEVSIEFNSGFQKNINIKTENGKIEKIIFVRYVPEIENNYYGLIYNKSGSVESLVKVSVKSG